MSASTTPATTICIDLEVSFLGEKANCVAVVKTQAGSLFTGDKAAPWQLQVVKLSGSPYDTLHALLHHSLVPFFRSFVRTKTDASKEPKGLVNVTKKMAELEVTLYNCKQDVQIEPVKLSFLPEIVNSAQQVSNLLQHHL